MTDQTDYTDMQALAQETGRRLGCEVIPAIGKKRAPSWEGATGYQLIPGEDSTLALIDIDDPRLLHDLWQAAPNIQKARTVKTPGGGFHVYVCFPDSYKGNLHLCSVKDDQGNERASLRTGNNGTMGEGSLHPNGSRYERCCGDAPLALSELEAKKLLNIFGANTPSPSPIVQKGNTPVPPLKNSPIGEKRDERNRTQQALSVLSSHRADDYHTWVEVGQALKAGFGDSGLPLWEGWSAQSPKYKPGECARKWNSFKGSGLTLATVYKWADEDHPGWRRGFSKLAKKPSKTRPITLPETRQSACTSGGIPDGTRVAALTLRLDVPMMVYEAVAGAGLQNFSIGDVKRFGFDRRTVSKALKCRSLFSPLTAVVEEECASPSPFVQKGNKVFVPRRNLVDTDTVTVSDTSASCAKKLPTKQAARYNLRPLPEVRESLQQELTLGGKAVEGLNESFSSALPFVPRNSAEYRRGLARAFFDNYKLDRCSHRKWGRLMGISASKVKGILNRAGIRGECGEAMALDLTEQDDPVRVLKERAKGAGKATLRIGDRTLDPDHADVPALLRKVKQEGQPIKGRIFTPSQWEAMV